MTLVQALILGVIEGITEFLPISSTAHLIIASNFLKLPQSEFVSFYEVFIQSGAILAVVLLYWKLLAGNRQNLQNILISFIPTAIIGFLMRDIIKDVFFQSNSIIGSALVIVGVVFLYVEYLVSQKKLKLTKDIKDMTTKEALLIGTIQAFAIVPGVSRAGAVIVGMMFMRYKRTDAALYSFLLAVPTIGAAGAYDLIKTDLSLVTENLGLIVIGSVVSFVTAFYFVKWLIQYLQNNSLNAFAFYRIAVGMGVVLMFT